MKIIHETNRGEIKIIEFEGFNYVVAKTHISLNLASKFGEKYNAVVPNVSMALRFFDRGTFIPLFKK